MTIPTSNMFSFFSSKTPFIYKILKCFVACVFFLSIGTSLAHADATAQLEKAKEAYFSGDYVNSAKLFKPLADSGNAEAQYYLGLVYKTEQFQNKDADTATSYLLSAADQNHADAMWALGQIYDNGDGVEKDVLAAMDWYRKSEQLNPPFASGVLFLKSKEGTLVKQDPAEVIDDLKRNAENGDIESLYKLGKTYDLGVFTQENKTKAFNLYFKAATKGHEHSAFLVGYFYCRGIGVAVDQSKANEWLAKSGRDTKCK